MLLVGWLYGLLAWLGLRKQLARILFLGLGRSGKTALLRMLKDEMEEPPSSSTETWADLSPELLGLVFLRLPTCADRAHFPAVCRQWRSSMRQCHVPPLSPFPWLVLPGGNIIKFPHGETFHLPDAIHYHNSCGQWLLLSHEDDSCFLLDPFTKATVPLPSLSSYITHHEHVETINDHVDPEDDMHSSWMDIKDLNHISVIALVMCSPQLIAALVAICGLGSIVLCRPGAAAWSVSAHDRCRWLSDMVFFQGKLYAVDAHNEDLLSIDIVDELDNDGPRVSRIERIIKGAPLSPLRHFGRMLYLLESHGRLMMVRREVFRIAYTVYTSGRFDWMDHPKGSNEFDVFEADLRRFLWADVSSLGNEVALFIGQGCSRAVHVSPYDMSPDCIFFMDDYTGEKTTTYCGAYDMKDGKVYTHMWMVSSKSEDVPATWLFSQGKMDKLQTSEHLQEVVEPGEEEPVTPPS